MEQEGKSLLDFVEAVFRNGKLVLITASLVLVGCAAYAILAKPEYGSSMRILVQNSRSNTIIGAGTGQAPGIISPDMLESEVNSEVELLQANDLIEGLVRYRDKELLGIEPPAEGSVELARQVQAVQRAIEVNPIRKTNMIQVNFTDKSPANAQKSLEWLSTHFLNKQAELRRPAGTFHFFETQAEQYEAQLRDAEAKLVEFDRANGVTSLEQEQQLLLQKLSGNTQDAQQTQALLDGEAAKMNQLRTQKSGTAPRVQTQIVQNANAMSTEHLESVLADLQNRRIELLTRYKSDDRLVREVDAEIASTRAILDRIETKQAAATTSDANPVMNLINEDMERTDANISADRARLTALNATSKSYQARLEQLQQMSLQRDALDRQVQELRENVKKFTEKRDDAEIDDQLDKSKIVDVAISEEPTISSLPVRPHRKSILMLGAVFACFLCGGMVFAKEALRDTMYAPYELEAASSSPVIATIPEIAPKSPSRPALEARKAAHALSSATRPERGIS
jgi:uncharacterized protein involved in exopolysaccharide biosynthesis